MRAYLRSFRDDTRAWLHELEIDRNYVGVGLVVVFLPLIFLADLVAHLVDVGPAPPAL